MIGLYVDVAAAHDSDHMSADEAATIFEDSRDAERGRRFNDEASLVEQHPHTGDNRRLLDQDRVVSDHEEVVQDGRDRTEQGLGQGCLRWRIPVLASHCRRTGLATTSAPRALKLRTGFAVSSLMLTVHPRSGSSASQRYSGVSRKIGSIARPAARIRAVFRRVSCTTQHP
jgi:hypothetical protein